MYTTVIFRFQWAFFIIKSSSYYIKSSSVSTCQNGKWQNGLVHYRIGRWCRKKFAFDSRSQRYRSNYFIRHSMNIDLNFRFLVQFEYRPEVLSVSSVQNMKFALTYFNIGRHYLVFFSNKYIKQIERSRLRVLHGYGLLFHFLTFTLGSRSLPFDWTY